MLGLNNSGRILSKRYHELVNKYYEDEKSLSDREKEYINADEIKKAGVKNDRRWLVEEHSIDTHYEHERYQMINARKAIRTRARE